MTFQEDPQLREPAKEAERNLKDIMDELKVREDKGLAEGSTNTAIQMIKRLLTRRFGSLTPAVTEVLDKKAEGKTDKAEYDRLFDLAMDCVSLEQFEQGLS